MPKIIREPSTLEYVLADGTEVSVDYYYSPGRPARISGPPENCCPEEPAEAEVANVRCSGKTEPELAELFKQLEYDEALYAAIMEHEYELQAESDADYAEEIIAMKGESWD